jgi:hypothetical protein
MSLVAYRSLVPVIMLNVSVTVTLVPKLNRLFCEATGPGTGDMIHGPRNDSLITKH